MSPTTPGGDDGDGSHRTASTQVRPRGHDREGAATAELAALPLERRAAAIARLDLPERPAAFEALDGAIVAGLRALEDQ